MVSDDDSIMEVFLQPGELYCGDATVRIRTLLGSCVAITVWHPRWRIGGMTHCLLPTDSRGGNGRSNDGRYVDEAIETLVSDLFAQCGQRSQFQAKLFGGSDMFGAVEGKPRLDIGGKNIARAIQLLDAFGLPLVAKDVGGRAHRSLIFQIATGDVWVSRGAQAGLLDEVEVFE